MDPGSTWLDWGRGQREAAELEIHSLEHLRGLICQTGLTGGRKWKFLNGGQQFLAQEIGRGHVSLLLESPHWAKRPGLGSGQPSVLMPPLHNVSSKLWHASTPAQWRLLSTVAAAPTHLCRLLQSPGRASGQRSQGSIWRSEPTPPLLDASKTASVPRSIPLP